MSLLASPLEEERLQGLKALARTGLELPVDVLYNCLGDESWRVRKEAIELFLALPRASELASEVIELLHAEENAGLRNAAVEILVRLGRHSLKSLHDELSCSDHDVRKFVLDILGDIGDADSLSSMLGALSDPDQNVRAAAVENLGKLGLPEAVPALLQTLSSADLWLRFTVLEALARIGVGVQVAPLLPLREEPLLRKALFDCFGRIGQKDAIPVLIDGLLDPARNVRESAAAALVQIGGVAETDVGEIFQALAGTPTADALAEQLTSSSVAVRLSALQLLRWVQDCRFAARLLELCADETLREEAVSALVGLGRDGILPLLDDWRRIDSFRQACLAYVMGEVGCSEGLESLLDGLGSDEPELRCVCALSLGKLGDEAAVEPLAAALADPVDEVRAAVVQALCRLGERHRERILRVLRPLLEAEEAELRMHVVTVLGHMNGNAVPGMLSMAMKDESPLVRREAVRALERSVGAGVISALTLALTDEDAEVRRLSTEALGRSGDRKAAMALELALKDEDIWVRAAAVRSLAQLGGTEVLAPMRVALGDLVGMVAIAAVEALATLDPDRAFPLLLEALSHDDEEVVITALHQLATSGHYEWLPGATERLLNHRHWEVRITFVRLLAEHAVPDARELLETRLLVEGEEPVRQLLLKILSGDSTPRG